MEQLVFVSVLLGIIILVMVMQYINSRRNDKIYIEKLNKEFGTIDRTSYNYERLNSASGYYIRHKSDGHIDDITWSDLSMDDIYAMLDTTESAVGHEILYHILRTPLYSQEEIYCRQRVLRFWQENTSVRNRIQLLLHNIGKVRKYSIYDYLDTLSECNNTSTSKYLIRIILLVLSVCSMLFLGGYGVVIFLLVLFSNVYVYYRDKAAISAYLSVIDDVYNMYIAAENIENIIGKEGDTTEIVSIKLSECISGLKSYKRLGGSSASSLFILLANTLGFILFADLIRFNKLKSITVTSYEIIDRLIYEIGYMDACISLASYVLASRDRACEPIYDITDLNIHIKGVTHPLIDNAVANDIDITKSILLTGANASGKSTFLKSIALAMLMSQTVTVVCANEYKAPIIRVISSMSVKDNVNTGDSYYMAEIKSVKRIFDEKNKLKNTKCKLVCFVDELLKGTNTIERIAAATQVLRLLGSDDTIVCAATHDLELTDLLSESYVNYHFKEDLSDGDVSFSYRLLEGPASTRNAIILLKNLGYSETITQNAEEMVKHYEEDGVWV